MIVWSLLCALSLAWGNSDTPRCVVEVYSTDHRGVTTSKEYPLKAKTQTECETLAKPFAINSAPQVVKERRIKVRWDRWTANKKEAKQ